MNVIFFKLRKIYYKKLDAAQQIRKNVEHNKFEYKQMPRKKEMLKG